MKIKKNRGRGRPTLTRQQLINTKKVYDRVKSVIKTSVILHMHYESVRNRLECYKKRIDPNFKFYGYIKKYDLDKIKKEMLSGKYKSVLDYTKKKGLSISQSTYLSTLLLKSVAIKHIFMNKRKKLVIQRYIKAGSPIKTYQLGNSLKTLIYYYFNSFPNFLKEVRRYKRKKN